MLFDILCAMIVVDLAIGYLVLCYAVIKYPKDKALSREACNPQPIYAATKVQPRRHGPKDSGVRVGRHCCRNVLHATDA